VPGPLRPLVTDPLQQLRFDAALSKQSNLAGSLATQFWVPAAFVREKL